MDKTSQVTELKYSFILLDFVQITVPQGKERMKKLGMA